MEESKIFKIRHSLAHILAMAVLEKFPDAKLGVGPVIDNGFYYDFLLTKKLSDEDLPDLEARMKKIVQTKIAFTKTIVERPDALNEVAKNKQNFKTELINDLPVDEELSFYQSGNFKDLCRGPHVASSEEINAEAFCLTQTAGAYWRGDEKREMLVRIYGLAFETQKELADYKAMLEEAKKRDHRLLGKQLDLFTFSELVGPGLPLWTPKGTILRQELDAFIWQLRSQYDYQKVTIPHITKKSLYDVSGHSQKFADGLFTIITREGHEFAMKPMNCPHHCEIYNDKPYSYKELPKRFAEFGTVYRYEKSGVLHGLMRVRGFTQDDAHIYCRLEQLEEEIVSVIKFVIFVLKTFGFNEYDIYISTRPENSVGNPEHWEKATDALKKAIEHMNLAYQVDSGEGVFYGPKIDIKIKDCFGRSWQCSTIQVDFNIPNAFKIEYIGEDGKPVQPVMIHRALMGSLERFFGLHLSS